MREKMIIYKYKDLTMKKWLTSLFIVALVTTNAVSGDLIINGEFNNSRCPAKITLPAKILKQGGFADKEILEVVGINKVNQYPAIFKSVPVKPGEKYGFSCNYKNRGTISSSSIMIITIFYDKNKKQMGSHRKVYQKSAAWRYICFDLIVPPKASSMQVALRLINVPATCTVFFSNIKLADLSSNKDFFMTDFKTHFEPWDDSVKVFEHFSIRPSGKILRDWKLAKVGEACFMANGTNEAMQYPFKIDRIRVHGNKSYVFEVDYKTSKGIASNDTAMLLFYYYDAENKKLRHDYLFVAKSKGQWKAAKKVMIAPKGSKFLDIHFNLRNIASVETIYLDNIRFYTEKPRAYVKFLIYPETKTLKTFCSTTSVLSDDFKSASIVISTDKTEKCRIAAPLNVKQAIDIAAWKNGKYSIYSVIETKSGKKIKSKIKPFNIFNKIPWLNNKLGILSESASPPVPWNRYPFSFNNGTVITWNNRITFSNNLQLKSISYSKDKYELLSAPMQFLVNGKDVFKKEQNSPAKYKVNPHEISSANNIKGDGFDLQVKTLTDYTGFVKYELTLKATRNIELNQARLVLSANGVEFLNQADGSWTYSKAFDLVKDKGWKASRFFPVIWLGNMKRGLYWYCEKLYPAKETMSKVWASVDTAGKLTIDIVNKPLKLAAGQKHSIAFGIGVTPNRPDRKLWRTLRFRGGKFNNFDNLWAVPKYFKYYGFPKATGERAVLMDKYVKATSHYKMFYQCPTYIATNLPQWSYFKQAWEANPARRYFNVEGLDYDLAKGNYKDQTWTDFYLQNFVSFMKKFKFNGVYHDCEELNSLMDGKDFAYPVFALRRYLRRIYIAQRQLNPDSFTVSHIGINFACPPVAFSDVLLMGENYRQGCIDNNYYLEFISLRLFRAENAASIGANRMFLPQFRQTNKREDHKISLHTLGLVMCHNLILYPNCINQEMVKRVRDFQYTFGMDNTDFFPYWEKNPYGIKTDNPKVICSFYKNSKGFLLSMLNSTNKAQKFKVKLKKLGVDMPSLQKIKIVLFEPLSNKKSKIDLGTSIKLKPYMAVFMLIEK
jgi:Glycoside hydrolase 123, N-terminal domain